MPQRPSYKAKHDGAQCRTLLLPTRRLGIPWRCDKTVTPYFSYLLLLLAFGPCPSSSRMCVHRAGGCRCTLPTLSHQPPCRLDCRSDGRTCMADSCLFEFGFEFHSPILETLAVCNLEDKLESNTLTKTLICSYQDHSGSSLARPSAATSFPRPDQDPPGRFRHCCKIHRTTPPERGPWTGRGLGCLSPRAQSAVFAAATRRSRHAILHAPYPPSALP